MNLYSVKKEARDILKGNYALPVVIALTLFSATVLFSYLDTLIMLIFDLVDPETSAYKLNELASFGAVRISILAVSEVVAGILEFIVVELLTLGSVRWLFKFVRGEKPDISVMFFYFGRGSVRALLFRLGVFIREMAAYIVCCLPGAALYLGVCIKYADQLGGNGLSNRLISALTDQEMLMSLQADVMLLISSAALLLITGVVAASLWNLRYWLSSYVYASDDTVSGRLAIKTSVMMLSSHKIQIIVLGLSFAGWMILSILTLGILLLFTVPYIMVSYAVFARIVIDVNLNPFTPPCFVSPEMN